MNNNEINTTELLTELADFMELYSHDAIADEMRELAFNISLIEEADRIRENS